MRIYNVPDHTDHIQQIGYPLGADDNAADQCEECGEDVYAGDFMYLYNGQWICSDCFRYSLKIRMITDLESLAELIGVNTKTAGK